MHNINYYLIGYISSMIFNYTMANVKFSILKHTLIIFAT
jgi:hypothetical protein